jgi:hypothetical protein
MKCTLCEREVETTYPAPFRHKLPGVGRGTVTRMESCCVTCYRNLTGRDPLEEIDYGRPFPEEEV